MSIIVISDNKPGNPANTTEVAEVAPGNPANTTEVAEVKPDRVGGDVVNLNFAQQLYNVDFDYARASSASYIDRFINEQSQYNYVLRNDYVGSVTNLVKYSEQFDNAAWVKSNSIVIENFALNSQGLKTACLLYPTTSGTLRNASNTITGRNTNLHTVSFDLKSNGFEWALVVDANGSTGVWFNLINGSIGQQESGSTGAIESLCDGWYRCSVTSLGAATSVAKIMLADSNGSTSSTASGKSGVLVDRAQLTESAKPLPYVKTLDAAVTQAFTAKPRIEYAPETGECLGYLAEGASTNLALRSDEFTNASWSKIATTVTANDAISPDGTKSATLLRATTNLGGYISQSIVPTADTIYTVGCFFKTKNRNTLAILVVGSGGIGGSARLIVNLAEETFSIVVLSGEIAISGSLKNVGNGWYRVSFTFNSLNNTSIQFRFSPHAYESLAVGDESYIWGAQLEALPFATSYIRTVGAAVSRAADVLTASGDIPDINELVSINYRASVYGQAGTSIKSVISHNGIANRNIYAATSGVESHRAFHGASSVPFGDSVPNVQYKISYVYDRSTLSLYVDSVLKSGASAQLESGETNGTVSVGHLAGANALYGHIKEVAIYNRALTQNEVKAL